MSVRAIRGAITANENTKEEIASAASILLSEILKQNGLTADDLIFILLTATEDLTAEFPASGVRLAGLSSVPVICARELSIEDSLPSTIRALVLIETEKKPDEVSHVYLREAKRLRSRFSEMGNGSDGS